MTDIARHLENLTASRDSLARIIANLVEAKELESRAEYFAMTLNDYLLVKRGIKDELTILRDLLNKYDDNEVPYGA